MRSYREGVRAAMDAGLRSTSTTELRCETSHWWHRMAVGSGLDPMVRVAKTLLQHQQGLLNWFWSRISNGLLEGISSRSPEVGPIGRPGCGGRRYGPQCFRAAATMGCAQTGISAGAAIWTIALSRIQRMRCGTGFSPRSGTASALLS